MQLRGCTTASDKRRGRTLSCRARSAKPPAHHGPLQRLLAFGRKFLAHDASDYLRSHRLTTEAQMGVQRLVDEGLVPFSSTLGQSSKLSQDGIVEKDRNSGLPLVLNDCTALPL